MKNLSILSFIIICLVGMTTAANATGLDSDFKDYEIEKVENLYLGKKVENVWTLSYGTDEKPVTVVKRNTLDGPEFIVFSKHFEVSYSSTASGFGATKVSKSWSNVPKRINTAVINNEQMQRQRIITPKQVNDEVALGLIANYLPELINDGYKHLLN